MNANIYRCIGKGFCGSVWALEDEGTVIKREDGSPDRSVTKDHNTHLLVLQSALQHGSPSSSINIPQCHALVQPADTWWNNDLHRFPAGYSACRAIISQRIPKIPRSISDKIVDLYCSDSPQLSQFVKDNPDDDPCLICPYLGRRRRYHQDTPSESRFRRFSLRNVPLHIDQMEAIGLYATAYAKAMAEALALMHWGAGIDANDVEFVLAPPRAGFSTSSAFQSAYLGAHSLWILDFDLCHSLSKGKDGVQEACEAFFKNDPFYPRPGSVEPADEELWKIFKGKFLETSFGVLGQTGGDVTLAEKLMEMIERKGDARRKEKSNFLRKSESYRNSDSET